MKILPHAAVTAILLAIVPGVLSAQSPEPAAPMPAGPLQGKSFFHSRDVDFPIVPSRFQIVQEERKSGMPAWLKWGLIGGAGTAALAALLSSTSVDADPPGAGESAAKGFVIGFVVVGGSVALWEMICKPGGWSEERGLCTGSRQR